MAPTTPVADPKQTAPKPSLIPPEEQFWERYSPHQEAPLSGVTSAVLHILGIGLLIGIIWLQAKLKRDEENRSVPIEPVRFAGGGGGSPDGKGNGSGAGDKTGDGLGKEAGEEEPPLDNKAPRPPEDQKLSPAQRQGVESLFKNDPAGEQFVKSGVGTTALDQLLKIEDGARQALRKAVRSGGQSKGQGGSGTDGGRDAGTDKGQGSGRGPGTSDPNKREKRVLRWGMTFNTQSGSDYLAQLAGLGAMVAMPVEGNEGQFYLLRELKDPTNGKVEDVTKLDSIYWIDDKPESVRSLLSVVKNFGRPTYFVAFFPYKIEKKLLDLEMDYANRKYGIKDEGLIHETKFDVVRGGDGYDVRVREVVLKPK